MKKLKKHSDLYILLVFSIMLFLTTGLTVIFPTTWNVIINILAPIVVLFIIKSKLKPFEIIKISTLLLGRILIPLAVLGILDPQWLIIATMYLFRLNILEATIPIFGHFPLKVDQKPRKWQVFKNRILLNQHVNFLYLNVVPRNNIFA